MQTSNILLVVEVEAASHSVYDSRNNGKTFEAKEEKTQSD